MDDFTTAPEKDYDDGTTFVSSLPQLDYNETDGVNRTPMVVGPLQPSGPPVGAARAETVVALSLLFCMIETVGIVGNLLVIVGVMADRKMRRSPTNLFIMNLAVADFLIMVCGVPEIVQFMLNRGWLMGLTLCRLERFILVGCLYASIMTLMAVCIERYIATVHPIEAHIVCSRRHTLVVIGFIWPLSTLCALPTVLFNTLRRPAPSVPITLCLIHFPGDHVTGNAVFKAAEFTVFFLVPVVVQVALYCVIGRRLFIGTADLHRKLRVADGGSGKDSEAIRTRKGVVKMLIASVVVYFVSYAPAQLPLFYNLMAATPFRVNWSFLVFLMTLSYANSAANPVLYAAFSQNFRRRFERLLCPCGGARSGWEGGRGGCVAGGTVEGAAEGRARSQRSMMTLETYHPGTKVRVVRAARRISATVESEL